MRAAPRARPVGAAGPCVNTAPAGSIHTAPSTTPGCPRKSGAPDAEPTPAEHPSAPDPSQDGHALPPSLARLLKTAQQEIDRHVNDHGLCAICGSAFPCDRAALADLALSAM